MKKLLSVLIMMATLVSFGQKPGKIIEGKPGMYPTFVTFAPESAPEFAKGKIVFTDVHAKVIASVSASATKLIGYEKDQTGSEHYRYQQTIKGIPVENAIYIVHTKKSKVFAQNGKWIKDVPSFPAAAALRESTALAHALKFVNAKSYKWQVPSEEAFLKKEQNDPTATFYPKGELVYYSGEEDVNPSALRLAYKFDIYANYPLSRQLILVDAVNGKILSHRDLIHYYNVTGYVVSGYSGYHQITTDFTGSTYRLRETGRGKGINTYNMRLGGNYDAAIDFTDDDNKWTWNGGNNENDRTNFYATEAHWATEKTYDYYFTKFNRNSINNNGFALNSYVHANLILLGFPDNNNAFWDGSRMTYGDGGTIPNCVGNCTIKPFTTLDICGHEITHGLIDFTSQLIYRFESGALSEGFSDIFGTAIEFYARPERADWVIGEDNNSSIRDLSSPFTGLNSLVKAMDFSPRL